MEERYLRVYEVAAILALHPITVKRLIRAGDIPAIRIGKRGDYRVSEVALSDYIRRKRA